MKVSWLPLSAVFLGILWMFAGGVAFTIMGSLIKHLSQTLPITVIVFFRMLVALTLLLPWIMRNRFASVATSRLGLHMLRSVTGFIALMCLVFSLSRLYGSRMRPACRINQIGRVEGVLPDSACSSGGTGGGAVVVTNSGTRPTSCGGWSGSGRAP